jgi:sterol 24-C-methyltransferase
MKRSILSAARTGLGTDEVDSTIRSYRQLHNDDSLSGDQARKDNYSAMVNQYYDLVTDFYEYGWGQSFHFASRRRGESLKESILRHEHYLAMRLGLGPGQSALDVGCGVGGPAREIASFSGANVLGLNNNAYQVGKAQQHTERAGMSGRCAFVEGDFMKMPLPDGSHDAAYAIESTCHAPDRAVAYGEVHRVLRPGSLFGGYEWCLTDGYNADNETHRRICRGIEEGDGLPPLTHFSDVHRALETAGFELLEARDLATECDAETPWYLPLSKADLTLTGLGRTHLGRRATGAAVRLLEGLGLAPRGASKVHVVLNRAADNLVQGGEAGIFTPMYFFLARKSQ